MQWCQNQSDDSDLEIVWTDECTVQLRVSLMFLLLEERSASSLQDEAKAPSKSEHMGWSLIRVLHGW